MNNFHPKEIDIEVAYCLLDYTTIPPLAYTYFLSFLCAYHVGDKGGQSESINFLKELLHDSHFGFDKINHPTMILFNLVGICHEIMGHIPDAVNYYTSSLKIEPITNIKVNLYSMATIKRIHVVLHTSLKIGFFSGDS